MFRWLFHLLALLAIGIWVGGIVFFSVVVAPGIFDALARPAAGDLMARLFPKYYVAGLLCGAAALVPLFLLLLFDSGSRLIRVLQMVLVAAMLLVTVYAGWVVEPEVHRLRVDRVTAAGVTRVAMERRFDALHLRAVQLNGLVLGLGVLGLGTMAARRRD